ncbi:MAG: acetoin utilization protein AcuC, partial [archaeon]|nr:acetoin utilization protein AcuC [archaeon]
GIQKVRKNNPNMKIMYLDIDAHHGDGTQWIFYDDPNVLTLSIHQDGRTLFPGTGFLGETGKGDGENYSINFPIFPGTYDEVYIDMFDKLIPKIMEAYKPDLLVTQLGVDTHFMDPLTMLGLSTQGHEKIYKLIKKYVDKYCNEKWVALGGGGYLMTVVPRSWTMALAVMLGENIPNQIPMDWIDFCEKNLDDEEAPFELRDRNVRVEEQLIKNPMFPVRIEESIDRIEKFVENEILPKIKS